MENDKEKIIVFTNGIFDILHPGHIALLYFAKSLGGKLVVAINSDRATKLLKGPERPVNNEHDRKKILEQFGFIDEVVIFDDTKTLKIIEKVNPNIVVKGAEWTPEEIRQRDGLPDHIEVKVFPLLLESSGEKHSTTSIIKKIRSNPNNQ